MAEEGALSRLGGFLNDFTLVFYHLVEAFVLKFVPRKYLRRKSIAGETVLITGAGSGLGRLLAIRFAKHGARLVLWDIDRNGNEETAGLIKAGGGEAWAFQCNVADRKAVYATAGAVKERVGRVDIIINNAGVVTGKKILDLSDEMIIKTFEVNTLAHFWVIKAFLSDMQAANHGHIVGIASLAGLGGVCRLTDYCASKFAAVGLQEALAMELATEGYTGIHTTTICPFFINTGMFAGADPGMFGFLEPDDVADKTVDAVLANQKLLIMPKAFYVLVALKTMLPHSVCDALAVISGVHTAMNTFVGRSSTKETNGSTMR